MATAGRKEAILGRLDQAVRSAPRAGGSILAEYEAERLPKKPAELKAATDTYVLSPMWKLAAVHARDDGLRQGFELENQYDQAKDTRTLYRVMQRGDGLNLIVMTHDGEPLFASIKGYNRDWSWQGHWIMFIPRKRYLAWIQESLEAPLTLAERPIVWRLHLPGEPRRVGREDVTKFIEKRDLLAPKVGAPPPPPPQSPPKTRLESLLEEFIAKATADAKARVIWKKTKDMAGGGLVFAGGQGVAAKPEGEYIPHPLGFSGWQHGDVRKSAFREGWERYNGDLMIWEQLTYDPTQKPR